MLHLGVGVIASSFTFGTVVIPTICESGRCCLLVGCSLCLTAGPVGDSCADDTCGSEELVLIYSKAVKISGMQLNLSGRTVGNASRLSVVLGSCASKCAVCVSGVLMLRYAVSWVLVAMAVKCLQAKDIPTST